MKPERISGEGRSPAAPESPQIASLRRKFARHLSEQAITEDKVSDARNRIKEGLHKKGETRYLLKDHAVAKVNKPTQKLFDKIAQTYGGP